MAASAGAIRAGKAFVELFADNSKLNTGLRAASAKLKAFGNDVRNIGLRTMAVGSAAAGALVGAGKYFASAGDSAAKAAKRTGMTAEAFSGLAYAADMSGASVEELEGGIRRMQRTLGEAVAGEKTAEEALAALGLTAKDLMGLTPEKQIEALADRLASVKNPAMKAAAAMEIFGRGGTALLPLLDEGAAGIADLVAEAERLGLIVSSEDAAKAEELNDAFDRMWKTIKRVAFDAGAALAPTLQRVAEWITRAAVTTSQWVRANQPLILLALKAAVAVTAVGAAIVTVGVSIASLGAVLGGLATAWSVIGSVIAGIGTAIGALLTPVGLVIAGVVALGAAILYWTGAAGQALTWLGERFQSLRAEVTAVVGGITDALMAGDIALALKVLWLGLRVEWLRGITWLSNTTDSAFTQLRVLLLRVWSGLQIAGMKAWDVLVSALESAVVAMHTAWSYFALGVQSSFEMIKATAAQAWNYVQGLFDRDLDVQAVNSAVAVARDDAILAAAEMARDQRDAMEQQMDTRRGERRQAREDVIWGDMEEGARLEAGSERRAQGREKELAKARKELDGALAEARRKREAARQEEPFKESKRRALEDPYGRLREAEVRGTFNAAGVLGLSVANTAQERTAKATEATAKTTARMLREIEDGGAVFS